MPEPTPPSAAHRRGDEAIPEPPLRGAVTRTSNPPSSPKAAPASRPQDSTVAAPVLCHRGTAWAVQLGAFSNRAKAEQLVAELQKRRYSAFILEYRASGQVLYRVRVGPEQDRARAEEIAARLAKDGFQPVVARHP